MRLDVQVDVEGILLLIWVPGEIRTKKIISWLLNVNINRCVALHREHISCYSLRSLVTPAHPQSLLSNQDSILSTIGRTLSSLQSQASTMGQELSEQNELIHTFDREVEQSHTRLGKAMDKMNDLTRTADGWTGGWTVWILVVVSCVCACVRLITVPNSVCPLHPRPHSSSSFSSSSLFSYEQRAMSRRVSSSCTTYVTQCLLLLYDVYHTVSPYHVNKLYYCKSDPSTFCLLFYSTATRHAPPRAHATATPATTFNNIASTSGQ